jgi:hypothetical protein
MTSRSAQRGNRFSKTAPGAVEEVLMRPLMVIAVALSWVAPAFGHGHDRMFTRDLTYIWQYDVGAELNAVRAMGWPIM